MEDNQSENQIKNSDVLENPIDIDDIDRYLLSLDAAREGK